MRILCLADEESKALWDFYKKEDMEGIDVILSCGDLHPSYLSYLATMSSLPVLYVHGNHDEKYRDNPPEGCICIEDQVYVYQGVRFVGLGGSQRYRPGEHQYTERDMKRRVNKLWLKIMLRGGFDVLVTHSPALGFHDGEDRCHQGFKVFLNLIDHYHPKYFVHGHVHMNYSRQFVREDLIGTTKVINAYEKYIIEI